MPQRIPHSDSVEVITGEKTTKDYLKMQKMLGKFYFKDFFSKFDKLKIDGRFLEVGPGPGYQTTLVAEKYTPTKIIGLEYSNDMIKVAEEYVKEKGLSNIIKYVNGAVENTDLIKSLGKFDTVYSTFSIHHWTNPAKGLKNLFEALNYSGCLFIYDFYRGGLFYYINVKRGIYDSIRASYRPEEIKEILTKAGIGNYSINRKSLYMDFIINK